MAAASSRHPRSQVSLPQRNGAIAKIKAACAFVVDDNEVEWRKLQKYLRKTTREAIELEADANIEVGAMIECIGGVHLGEWGRVVQVTNKSY